jgi:4a-hydroxytetrahydrobiopterin dehydratase
MNKLDDAAITRSLEELPGWKKQGDALTKQFELPTFARSVECVNAVAKHADQVDHHPDMLIQYNKVTFTLSTHDAGGITEKDVSLAKKIDALVK